MLGSIRGNGIIHIMTQEEKRANNRLALRKHRLSQKYRDTYNKRYAILKATGEQAMRGKEAYAKQKLDPVKRMRHLSRYGLSLQEYQLMHEAQGGVCYICHKPNTNNRILCVDHDHDTGKVRKLLCTHCNSRLGIYENNRKSFEAYLAMF